jgi:glycine dehydrogenase
VTEARPAAVLDPTDSFPRRHLGPNEADVEEMLAAIGADSLAALVEEAVPRAIRLGRDLPLAPVEGFTAATTAPSPRR